MVIVCWRWRSALGYHYSGANKYSTMIEICYRLPLLYCVAGKWRHFFCRVLLCYCVAVRANNSADARIILLLPDKQALLPCGALFCLFCLFCSQRCPLSPPFHAVFNSLKESNLKSQSSKVSRTVRCRNPDTRIPVCNPFSTPPDREGNRQTAAANRRGVSHIETFHNSLASDIQTIKA